MIIKDSRSADAFFNSIARHLSPGGEWRIDPKDDQLVHFGRSDDIRGEIVLDHEEGEISIANLSIVGGGYEDEDLETIEQAIAILEGLEYQPTPEEND